MEEGMQGWQEKWKEQDDKIEKAARNICQCLDGFTISDSRYVLDRVNHLLNETIICSSNIRGIDDKR